MASNRSEIQEDILHDPQKFLEFLYERIECFERTLGDDENFCNKEIDWMHKYIENIEKKFNGKIQAIKRQLEDIRSQNKQSSEENKRQFDNYTTEINDFYTSNKYEEARKKLKDYEQLFEQRIRLFEKIPKLDISESDIEELFLPNRKTNTIVVQSATTTTTIKPPVVMPLVEENPNDDGEESNDVPPSIKQKLRREKVIQSVDIKKDDEDTEEVDKDKSEQNTDLSTFGSISKRLESQRAAATNQNMITNDTKSLITTINPTPKYNFSTRLGAMPSKTNTLFSNRDVSTPLSVSNQNVNIRDHPAEATSLVNRPGFNQRQVTINSSGTSDTLSINAISLFGLEQNIRLLIACNSRYIVCFKSQLNRLDRWQLGVIERVTQREYSIDWHDGLIVSMGLIPEDNIYIFTEQGFFIYSLTHDRKFVTRSLKRGSNDTLQLFNPRNNEFQRGIGTIYSKYIYHIYTNHTDNWTLSKYMVKDVVHMYDNNLTALFPDVWRFISLSVDDNTINFLVQMHDQSYGVVFCSTNECAINDKMKFIPLKNARNPLSICSAFVDCLRANILFVNDPAVNILHILNTKTYLDSYPVHCYAMCYVPDKCELIIVTNNSISSIDFTNSSSYFSRISQTYASDV